MRRLYTKPRKTPDLHEPKEPPPPLWRRALKGVVFLLFLYLGSLSAKLEPANGLTYKDTSEFVGAVIGGALIALIYLVIVGSIGNWIARRRGRRRRWRASLTTFPALLVTLLLLVASASGRASQDKAAVEQAKPNPSGSAAERVKANLEAAAWERSRTPPLFAFQATGHRYPGFLKALRANGNTAAVRRMAARGEREYEQDQTRWLALPTTPLSDLRRIDAQMAGAIGLAAAAYADYLAGLKANAASGVSVSQDKGALALLDSGDAKLTRADRQVKAAGRRILALDKKYGIP